MILVRAVHALVLGALLVATPASAAPVDEPAPFDAVQVQPATYRVKKMACHGCAQRLEKGVRRLAGVTDVRVELKPGLAHVTYDPAKTDAQKVEAAIDKLGFEATLRTDPPASTESRQ